MIIDHTGAKISSVPRVDPLNDPRSWDKGDSSSPLSPDDIAAYQRQIDSIAGVTRDNKSTVKLVWNGDKRYWRDICIKWDTTGEPLEFIKRPILLFRSVFDMGQRLQYDIPVPRWLLLTRIEPEQYTPTWQRDSRVWFPDRGQYVQVKPEQPPQDGWYVWLMTIADHDRWCCTQAAEEEDRNCYGLYAAPGRGIEELEKMRAGMDRTEESKHSPFDSPDRLSQKLRERSVNDYTGQALRTYSESVTRFIESVPYKDLQQVLTEERDRHIDQMQKEQR